jgi:crotonobetainyl-CoA:carnitine CoA-transferase CaiB-like acyl-CoA transferase
MAVTGEPDRAPVRVGPSMIDMGTGMYVVIGVLDALRARDATGRGAYLDFNLMESAMSWMSQAIARYSQTGVVPPRTGSALATFSPYQVFNGGDGQQIFIGASTERFWLRLCDALGLETLPRDPRFIDMKSRVANRAALTQIIEKALSETPLENVLARLRAAGIPCAPVLAIDGVVADPHVAARGTLQQMADPAIGEILQTRMPIGEGKVPEPAPLLGQHGREILGELGYSAGEVSGLVEDGVVIAPQE